MGSSLVPQSPQKEPLEEENVCAICQKAVRERAHPRGATCPGEWDGELQGPGAGSLGLAVLRAGVEVGVSAGRDGGSCPGLHTLPFTPLHSPPRSLAAEAPDGPSRQAPRRPWWGAGASLPMAVWGWPGAGAHPTELWERHLPHGPVCACGVQLRSQTGARRQCQCSPSCRSADCDPSGGGSELLGWNRRAKVAGG